MIGWLVWVVVEKLLLGSWRSRTIKTSYIKLLTLQLLCTKAASMDGPSKLRSKLSLAANVLHSSSFHLGSYKETAHGTSGTSSKQWISSWEKSISGFQHGHLPTWCLIHTWPDLQVVPCVGSNEWSLSMAQLRLRPSEPNMSVNHQGSQFHQCMSRITTNPMINWEKCDCQMC